MSSFERWEAVVDIVAGVLVLAGWVVGGFPDPRGTGAYLFAVGLILAGGPAVRRVVAAISGRSPHRSE